MNVYNWVITPRIEKGNIALRQGVITALTENEAREYLLLTMDHDEKELYEKKDNLLVITCIYSY